MCWINYQHFNEVPPPGVYGGSLCLCSDCLNKRRECYRNGVEKWTVCHCGMQMTVGSKCSICGYEGLEPRGCV